MLVILNMKAKLFDLGKHYFGQYVNEHSDCYLCPICFLMFYSDEYLTLEHVPPESFGGTVMCLTCQKCNNDAGGTSEGHMSREVRSRKLGEETDEWQRARLSVNGLTLNVSARWVGGVFEINGLPNNNNPIKTQQFMELLKSNPKYYSFQIESAITFNSTMSASGFLKSAYLAAFSKFGYQYILKSALEQVRKQILRPEQSILPMYRLKLGGENHLEKKILIVNSPVKALVVQMGTVGIPLPGLDDNTLDVFDELYEISEGQEGSFNFDTVEWPIGMEMLIDKQLAARTD